MVPGSLSALQVAVFSLCLHMAEKGGLFLFLKGHQSYKIRALPLRPHQTFITSLEALSPNIVTVKVRASICELRDFSGGSVVKNLSASAGHMGSIPGPVRFHMPWGY